MEKPNREERRNWLDLPTTQYFFREILEDREEALQRLAIGLFSEEPGKQNILIGMINALTKILEKQNGDEFDD